MKDFSADILFSFGLHLSIKDILKLGETNKDFAVRSF